MLGELLDANIICAEDAMMVIAFDWAGKAAGGQATYPHLRLNRDLLGGCASKDLSCGF